MCIFSNPSAGFGIVALWYRVGILESAIGSPGFVDRMDTGRVHVVWVRVSLMLCMVASRGGTFVGCISLAF